MNCPKCGHEITKWRKRCEVCGQDISMYERLRHISNAFYNKGLERARVRDLSGAATMLKKSLEIDKENTNARNLLGLVYFEMGEVVAALSEWVISQNFDPQDSTAEYFLKKVQSDTVAFDGMNQTIRKFNIALANAKRQDDDLAILQLKRIISQNPKFVRALLLLALVYMKNSEYEKARRCLVRVQKVDVANVTALRYLEEIRINTQPGGQGAQEEGKNGEDSFGFSQIAPVNTYREDRPNFVAFITFFLGLLIGIAVIYYMAVPNIRKGIMAEYNQKERDYSSVISGKDITISSLESDIRILEAQVDDLERALRLETGYDPVDYEPLVELLYAYEAYLGMEAPTIEQTEELLSDLEALDMTEMINPGGVTLYKNMLKDMKERAGAYYLAKGAEYMKREKPDAALPYLEQAYTYTPENPSVLFNLAKASQGVGDLAQAKTMYETLINNHGNSEHIKEAEKSLEQVNKALKEAGSTTE